MFSSVQSFGQSEAQRQEHERQERAQWQQKLVVDGLFAVRALS